MAIDPTVSNWLISLTENTTAPDWISATAAGVGAIAVVVGLLTANSKYSESRRMARQLRNSEVAEELIALAHNVKDALKDIRNPFDSIPVEEKDNKLYTYFRRHNRLTEYNDLFKKLREAQIRTRAVIGDTEVDEAVDILFKARHKVSIAIKMLADLVRDDEELRGGDRELRIKLRSDLFASGPERNTLCKEIDDAVSLIEARLNPLARLETY